MTQRQVDLRSDTVTRPTEKMRAAMMAAPVGDDAYGEDPTVRRLEEMAAAKVGMEAGLYVPSGSMGNRCALVAHTRPGDEVVYGAGAHAFFGARAEAAVQACLAARSLPVDFGVIRPQQIDEVMAQANPNRARPALVWMENSHNLSGGSAWLPTQVEALGTAVHRHGLKLHIDGARIFNAAVAVGADVQQFTRHADSVMFCASKGLSAPVGSLLCGGRNFIERARVVRTRLGGTMRQAGVIAAAAAVALETMVERLAQDQAHALLLHQGLLAIDGLQSIQPPQPTNFCTVDCSGWGWSGQELVDAWKTRGILAHPRPPHRVRLVFHRHIDAADVEYVLDCTQRLAADR
ncbi:MAG: aminotransferase class V-fold PLP-dependent enzyme [Candidatus Latescibacteria bacterium]|nr:aminotransferase class V-fold PLP-dependent enzyme [Candidatus Latescibacterota bacterium]